MAFGVKFNGKPIPDWVKVKAVSYTVLPELQSNFKRKTSGVGLVDSGTQILGKTIKMDIAIIGQPNKSVMTLSQELAGWLMGDNFKASKLEITDGETVTWDAKVSNGVEISETLHVGEGTIEFIAPSGVAQGGNSSVTVNNGEITCHYTGTAVTYPKITLDVTHDTSSIVLTEPSLNRSVTIRGSWHAGDTVEIDNQGKRIRVNGFINMHGLDLSSTWISFPTMGTYTVHCQGNGTWTCIVPLKYY